MVAKPIFRDKYFYRDVGIREMVIWQLPQSDEEKLHGLKYRLFYGYAGKSLVRYDNERGKGDHRHYANREELYQFESVEMLVSDFAEDILRLRSKVDE